MERKERREDVPIECSAIFDINKADFLRQFITMDETWEQHFIPETKEQSKQWTERGESAPKKAKTICWHGHGISFSGCTWNNFH